MSGVALALMLIVSYGSVGLLSTYHWLMATGVLFAALWTLPQRWWPWLFGATVVARVINGIIGHAVRGDVGPFLHY